MKKALFVFALALLWAGSAVAQDITFGQTHSKKMRNINGSTVYKYQVVETDTTAVKILDKAIPDTFTVDSLAVSPNALGPFFINVMAVGGTPTGDTLYITGTAWNPIDMGGVAVS